MQVSPLLFPTNASAMLASPLRVVAESVLKPEHCPESLLEELMLWGLFEVLLQPPI